MKNVGKVFEQNWKSSIPEDVFYYRLHDAPQSWSQNVGTKFSWKNPCDCFMFDKGLLLPLELKTTKDKFYTFERENEKNKTAKIHWHQIEGLLNYGKYNGVVAGFILNFRVYEDDEERYNEVTFFIHINDFMRMINEITKKSFTILDLLNYSPIKIESIKKRTNFKYNIEKFLKDIQERYGEQNVFLGN